MNLIESLLQRARRTVLIVDDEPVVLDLLEEILTDADLFVLRASNADEARKIISSTPFGVAILDKNMPDVSGMQLLRELKRDAPLSQALILTGYASLDSAVEAIRLHAFEYITKPFQTADLMAKVETGLARFSEKLHLEQDLSRHESLFESIPGLVWFIADEGRITRINKIGAAALGYDVNELIGSDYHVLLEDGQEGSWAFNERRTAPRAAVPKRVALKAKDGTTRVFEVHSAGTYSAVDGTKKRAFTGTAGVATDITDQLRLEEALRQNQKMESLGGLAGGVAHDFNNVLTIIGACVDLIRAQSLPDEAAGGLHDIEKACQRATSLTRQLLTFSHQRSRDIECFDAIATLREAETIFTRLVRAHISVEMSYESSTCFVELPHGALEQMMLNLVANARDALSEGGTIRIEIAQIVVGAERPELQAGRYLRIAVSDEGSGMDEETRNRAFEPFFTTKKPGEGTGLGLATVYGLATKHGGTAQIDSQPGSGTTVTILLPVYENRKAAPSRAPTPPPIVSDSNMAVLFVEDDELVRRSTEAIMERAGLETISAADGEKGLELFMEHRDKIGLLLTDVVMPGISGRTLARRVREVEPGLSVIFISGYAPDDSDEDVPGLFIGKPYVPADLVTQVRKALAASSVVAKTAD